MSPNEFKKFIDILKSMFPHAPDFDGVQLNAWYSYFQAISSATAFAAIPDLIETCDRFPSIKQLLAAMNPKPDHDAEARLIADKIWGAIERFGSLKSKQDLVRTAIGETGWKVVENMGGWRVVCEIASYDNVSTLKAQWRESAKALLDIADIDRRRDSLGLPPSHERQALPAEEPKNVLDVLALVQTRTVPTK
jgi:hypothetical protein